MMLIAASWPSNSDAAVTKRTLLAGLYSESLSAVDGSLTFSSPPSWIDAGRTGTRSPPLESPQRRRGGRRSSQMTSPGTRHLVQGEPFASQAGLGDQGPGKAVAVAGQSLRQPPAVAAGPAFVAVGHGRARVIAPCTIYACSFAVRAGTNCMTSATTRTSATSLMGASLSLLIATTKSDFLIPVRCWMAPLMPHAT